VTASSDGSTQPSKADEVSSVEGVGEVVDGEPAGHASDGTERRVVMAGAFSGPLPPPDVLADYERVQPGLGREIVDQWKAETRHRHTTIDGLRKTDQEAMLAYYQGERRGQYFALVIFAGILGVAATAIVLKSEAVGVAAILSAGGSAVWSMRRRPDVPVPPTDLAKGDELESPDGQSGDAR
jgi:uncharacterized membrane protein